MIALMKFFDVPLFPVAEFDLVIAIADAVVESMGLLPIRPFYDSRKGVGELYDSTPAEEIWKTLPKLKKI